MNAIPVPGRGLRAIGEMFQVEGPEGFVLSENDRLIEDAVFTGGLSARAIHPDGRPFHTFRTATLRIAGDRCVLRNCRIENTAGPGETAGQAIALYVDGDEVVLEDCVLTGHQDTLFLAPLPPTAYEKDGFIGPGEFAPRTPRRVHLHRCLIEGGVDFVFGGADCLFTECEFRSVEPGYVFAPSTPEGREGFVARHCRFTACPGVENGSVYLARPWREYAAVTLEDCYLGEHIAPAGFHDWNKTKARETVRFYESGSYGPGAYYGERPLWVHVAERDPAELKK